MRVSAGMVALALFVSGEALAQEGRDAAAVCAMAERHYAAIRAGDRDAIFDQHLPQFTFFMADGGLLWMPQSVDQQRTESQARSPSLTNRTWIHHCSAQVHGNTGIATFYLVGSVTIGDTTWTGTWRVTEVWVRQGNEWKEAHHHESPLLGAVRP